MFINSDTVFFGHCDEPYNLSRIAIYSTYVSNTELDQFFILVDSIFSHICKEMDLLACVVGSSACGDLLGQPDVINVQF